MFNFAYLKLLFKILNDNIIDDYLCIIINNKKYYFGKENGKYQSSINVKDVSLFKDLIMKGNLGLGEGYMDEKFTLIGGDLVSLLSILYRARIKDKIKYNFFNKLSDNEISIKNLIHGRYKNVQSHYDIGDELFESFLDETLTYSCGYKILETDNSDDLQQNKFSRICQKLRLQKDEKLLDIGCGYGALLIHAATNYNVQGTGITISKHHYKKAKEQVEKHGLSNRIKILFKNHNQIEGKYDKVVSVGMMEHLKRSDYDDYFNHIKRVLHKENGIGLVHTIGCNDKQNEHDPFIQKYIFPGSGQPRLSEMAALLEERSMPILDVEVMGRHYAPTVEGWNENFQKAYPSLDQGKYDRRFKRMWEYYFACGVVASRITNATVYQVLFSNNYEINIPYKRI